VIRNLILNKHFVLFVTYKKFLTKQVQYYMLSGTIILFSFKIDAYRLLCLRYEYNLGNQTFYVVA
jgi:hypothetical protein